MPITGKRHLRLVLDQYIDHYNTHGPHRAPHQKPPAGRANSSAAVTGMPEALISIALPIPVLITVVALSVELLIQPAPATPRTAAETARRGRRSNRSGRERPDPAARLARQPDPRIRPGRIE